MCLDVNEIRKLKEENTRLKQNIAEYKEALTNSNRRLRRYEDDVTLYGNITKDELYYADTKIESLNKALDMYKEALRTSRSKEFNQLSTEQLKSIILKDYKGNRISEDALHEYTLIKKEDAALFAEYETERKLRCKLIPEKSYTMLSYRHNMDNLDIAREFYNITINCIEKYRSKSKYNIVMTTALINEYLVAYLKSTYMDSLVKLYKLYKLGKGRNIEGILIDWYIKVNQNIINNVVSYHMLFEEHSLLSNCISKNNNNNINQSTTYTPIDISEYIKVLNDLYDDIMGDIKEQITNESTLEVKLDAKYTKSLTNLYKSYNILYRELTNEEQDKLSILKKK